MPKPEMAVTDHSTAWVFQVKLSFAVALGSLVTGIAYMPVDPWIRAYVGATALYTVTSAISLSKTLRDEHEAKRLISRVDEVKLERLLAEYDPFKVT